MGAEIYYCVPCPWRMDRLSAFVAYFQYKHKGKGMKKVI